jgi:uncharacterized protein (TIGR03000 family)
MGKERGVWVWWILAVSPLSVAAAPPPEVSKVDSTALITVQVPEGAEVWFEGRKTSQTGATRQFVTPPLEQGRHFTYRLKVCCTDRGGPTIQEQTLTVWAGARLSVDFSHGASAGVQQLDAARKPTPTVPVPANTQWAVEHASFTQSQLLPADTSPPTGRKAEGQTVQRATEVSKPSPMESTPTAAQSDLRKPEVSTSTREVPTTRRTITGTSSDACFAHDPEYHWLVGTLDYSKIGNVWILRYAPFGEEDRYGGSVTLVGLSRVTGFQSGQLVRVEGHLADTKGEQPIRPPYRAESIRPFQQP